MGHDLHSITRKGKHEAVIMTTLVKRTTTHGWQGCVLPGKTYEILLPWRHSSQLQAVNSDSFASTKSNLK